MDYSYTSPNPWPRKPDGGCTTYVAERRHVPWGGNAAEWYENASNKKWPVRKDAPLPGCIMCWNGIAGSDISMAGHVALVERVEGTRLWISQKYYGRGRGYAPIEQWIGANEGYPLRGGGTLQFEGYIF
ncbi:MAG: CHAP domain-containing protein [Armatimonadota bacterium]